MKKKKNELSNIIFEAGIGVALQPINTFLRLLPYPWGVAASIASIVVWSMPVILLFSIVSNTIFAVEIGAKLFKR